jgi:hypothetical protein
MSKEIIDITPEDSIVPIYRQEWSNEELTKLFAEREARQIQEQTKNAQKNVILEKLGLTEEELKIVLN